MAGFKSEDWVDLSSLIGNKLLFFLHDDWNTVSIGLTFLHWHDAFDPEAWFATE